MTQSPFTISALVAAIVATVSIAPARANDALPPVQQQGNISYLSGGIGKEETDALEAVKRNYNLRITSADKTGHYSGDIHIVITDQQNNIQLDTNGGPLFYANLPNGRYVVEGINDGLSKKQAITIADQKPVSVRFN
jgi:hypothetical protein